MERLLSPVYDSAENQHELLPELCLHVFWNFLCAELMRYVNMPLGESSFDPPWVDFGSFGPESLKDVDRPVRKRWSEAGPCSTFEPALRTTLVRSDLAMSPGGFKETRKGNSRIMFECFLFVTTLAGLYSDTHRR